MRVKPKIADNMLEDGVCRGSVDGRSLGWRTTCGRRVGPTLADTMLEDGVCGEGEGGNKSQQCGGGTYLGSLVEEGCGVEAKAEARTSFSRGRRRAPPSRRWAVQHTLVPFAQRMAIPGVHWAGTHIGVACVDLIMLIRREARGSGVN